jgi:hypothetical protein
MERWSRTYSRLLLKDETMMLDEQHSEELRALRNLERTVRAYSVTSTMVSVRRRQEMLAVALREVIEARKAAIRRSRALPLKDKPPSSH